MEDGNGLGIVEFGGEFSCRNLQSRDQGRGMGDFDAGALSLPKT
jgi:hypothetical protein